MPLSCSAFSLQGVTISNDGATIMKLLEIIHPAAKTLVDISLSQDAEVLPSLRAHRCKPWAGVSNLLQSLCLAESP